MSHFIVWQHLNLNWHFQLMISIWLIQMCRNETEQLLAAPNNIPNVSWWLLKIHIINCCLIIELCWCSLIEFYRETMTLNNFTWNICPKRAPLQPQVETHKWVVHQGPQGMQGSVAHLLVRDLNPKLVNFMQ